MKPWFAGGVDLRLGFDGVTAMSNEEGCRRVRDAGFDPHLVKPADPLNLVPVVDALWNAWAAGSEGTARAAGAPDLSLGSQ